MTRGIFPDPGIFLRLFKLRSHELRSKILALDLILLVVQNFNVILPEHHSFIYALRHFLCVALTHNAVSPIIQVFDKAMAIFVHLVDKFKVVISNFYWLYEHALDLDLPQEAN